MVQAARQLEKLARRTRLELELDLAERLASAIRLDFPDIQRTFDLARADAKRPDLAPDIRHEDGLELSLALVGPDQAPKLGIVESRDIRSIAADALLPFEPRYPALFARARVFDRLYARCSVLAHPQRHRLAHQRKSRRIVIGADKALGGSALANGSSEDGMPSQLVEVLRQYREFEFGFAIHTGSGADGFSQALSVTAHSAPEPAPAL
ncbi:MAG TPA: hypothetical protein VKY65_12840 [Alphaproteobacteria bacterium]|nr:hypothetical protein [Alphaproteobacteria bacterium]